MDIQGGKSMWDVDKMKIRWTNQAEEAQTEVFFEKGTATPENFRRLGKKRGGDCRIAVKREGFSEEEWVQMLCNVGLSFSKSPMPATSTAQT